MKIIFPVTVQKKSNRENTISTELKYLVKIVRCCDAIADLFSIIQPWMNFNLIWVLSEMNSPQLE